MVFIFLALLILPFQTLKAEGYLLSAPSTISSQEIFGLIPSIPLEMHWHGMCLETGKEWHLRFDYKNNQLSFKI